MPIERGGGVQALNATRAELAETMLASMLGLLALQLREIPQAEAVAVLDAVQRGACDLRFALAARGDGASLRATVAGSEGGEWELMALNFCPRPAAVSVDSAAPVEMLGALYAALSGSGFATAIPADVREWSLRSIRGMVQKGGSFDQHAGLAGRGRNGLAATLDLRNRDEALLRALDAVAFADAPITLWERCNRLAPLVRAFARADWPGVFGCSVAPPEWPAFKVALFDAARFAPGSTRRDPKLPVSAQRLHQIAKSNTPFSFSASPATVLAQHRKPEAS